MARPSPTPRERSLRTIRLLAQCYQAFERHSDRHVRELGLTPAQFDIVATLGNTGGMSFRELGERTLITKGTLTGVVDRLQARALVERLPHATDGRAFTVRLTRTGQELFERVFPEHVAHCRRPFAGWRESDFGAVDAQLRKLHLALRSIAEPMPPRAAPHPKES